MKNTESHEYREWPADRSKIVELVLSATKLELQDEVRQVSFQT